MELRNYQNEAMTSILNTWEEGTKRTLLVLPTGCHAKGEELLMADGTIKEVQDIKLNDLLIGSDGKARTVLHLQEGYDDLYKITPVKGEPFIVTRDHKLTLVRTREKRNPMYPCQTRANEVVDVSVEEWLMWSKWKKVYTS